MAEEKESVLKLSLKRTRRKVLIEHENGSSELLMRDPKELTLLEKSKCLRILDLGSKFTEGKLSDKEIDELQKTLDEVVGFMVEGVKNFFLGDGQKMEIVEAFFKVQKAPALGDEGKEPVRSEAS